jgi:hypothetical protein
VSKKVERGAAELNWTMQFVSCRVIVTMLELSSRYMMIAPPCKANPFCNSNKDETTDERIDTIGNNRRDTNIGELEL